MKISKGESGFTLIEIIVVLVILSIMAVVLTNAIVYGVQSYIFARNANHLSQKAQLAMARINRELTDMTAVTTASADQIDYTLTKSTAPSCTVSTGCQYSLKRTGTQITLEGTNPVVAAQVLIDGVTADYDGTTKKFLSYFQSDGTTAWTTAYKFSNANSNANYLATIQVRISLDFPSGGKPPDYLGTINPRANGVLTAPLN